jgi:hypothetical protein
MSLRSVLAAAILGATFVTGCAAAPPPAAAPAPPPTTAPSPVATPTPPPAPVTAQASSEAKCDVVCQGARVTALSAGAAKVSDSETHSIRQAEAANQVFEAMHDDLLACYKARVRVAPNAKGTVTFSILVGPDGAVKTIEPSGGETLGSAKEGMMKRIQKATFKAPHGGGTMQIQVPFTLQLRGADEST